MANVNAAVAACLELFVALTVAMCGQAQGTTQPVPDLAASVHESIGARSEPGSVIALFIETPEPITVLKPEDSIHFEISDEQNDVQKVRKLIADRHFDRALETVAALEAKRPGNVAIFNLRGAIYSASGDFANARKWYERALEVKPTSMVAAMNLAELDLREKNPDAARRRFQSILAIDQANAEAMLGLAGVAEATGQESEYISWLNKSSKAAPRMPNPRVLLAKYYLQKNDLLRALTVAREGQIVSPDNPEVLDVLGTIELAARETDNAVATYSRLAGLLPDNPVAQYRLATAQAANSNIDAARSSLNKALTLKPDYLPAEILLASAELDAGRFREALKITQQIEEKHPESASGFALQGNVLMAQKQFAPALQAYERAFTINKTGLLMIKVHQALSAAGNLKEADARLRQWFKDQPNDVIARLYLAQTYLKARQNKQAIEQYQLLLQADPANIRALNDLAWLYQQEKDPRAVATAEQGYKLGPDDADIIDTLAWILVEQGNTTRGLELLQKAAQKAPASAEIRYHLAVALAKSGNKARARQELQDLLAKNHTFMQREAAQALLKQL
jgi:putative PEP-CTERM system TPR-repeat lipoprotein